MSETSSSRPLPALLPRFSPAALLLALALAVMLAMAVGVAAFSLNTGSGISQSDVAAAEHSAYQNGHDAGYQAGLTKGKTSGQTTGYKQGKHDGFQAGHRRGKAAGLRKGHAAGYTQGYAAGFAAAQATQTTQTTKRRSRTRRLIPRATRLWNGLRPPQTPRSALNRLHPACPAAAPVVWNDLICVHQPRIPWNQPSAVTAPRGHPRSDRGRARAACCGRHPLPPTSRRRRIRPAMRA